MESCNEITFLEIKGWLSPLFIQSTIHRVLHSGPHPGAGKSNNGWCEPCPLGRVLANLLKGTGKPTWPLSAGPVDYSAWLDTWHYFPIQEGSKALDRASRQLVWPVLAGGQWEGRGHWLHSCILAGIQCLVQGVDSMSSSTATLWVPLTELTRLIHISLTVVTVGAWGWVSSFQSGGAGPPCAQLLPVSPTVQLSNFVCVRVCV